MAAPKKLKVFRTVAGFHDAYVAAPTQKAALEAWGSDHNLFARGVAEIVTDEKLTAEPLANPGKVIKRLRGTADEQMAALPERKPSAKRTTQEPAAEERATKRPAPKKAPPPRPSRRELDEAEQVLADMEARHREEADAVAERLAKIERERRTLEKAQEAEREKLEAIRERSKAKYDRAIEEWRD